MPSSNKGQDMARYPLQSGRPSLPLLRIFCGVALCFILPKAGWGFSGTEGASFLEIPVGARPAALGDAYTALATDAYAPLYNPAGLGFSRQTELAGQHISY